MQLDSFLPSREDGQAPEDAERNRGGWVDEHSYCSTASFDMDESEDRERARVQRQDGQQAQDPSSRQTLHNQDPVLLPPPPPPSAPQWQQMEPLNQPLYTPVHQPPVKIQQTVLLVPMAIHPSLVMHADEQASRFVDDDGRARPPWLFAPQLQAAAANVVQASGGQHTVSQYMANRRRPQPHHEPPDEWRKPQTWWSNEDLKAKRVRDSAHTGSWGTGAGEAAYDTYHPPKAARRPHGGWTGYESMGFDAMNQGGHGEEWRGRKNANVEMSQQQFQKELKEAARSKEYYLAFLGRSCSDKIAFDAEQLSALLHVTGEFCMPLPEEVLDFFHARLVEIQEMHGGPAISASGVANSLFGLQGLGDSPKVRKLVKALTQLVRRCREKLSGQQIGWALFGLHGFSNSLELRQLLAVLTPKLRGSETLEAEALGNTLYGLQNMRDTREVRQFLKVLAPKLRQCPNQMSAEHVSNALLGLRNCGASSELRKLVSALTEQVRQCGAELSAEQMSIACTGLQRLGDSQEVRELAASLASHVQRCGEPFDGGQIASALHGLQTLCDSKEARQLLAALTPKVTQCEEKMPAQMIGKALFGLQNLGDSPEMRQLVVALTSKVERCTEPLSADAVGKALYGLQRLGSSPEARQLVAALTPKVEQCGEELSAQQLSNALYGVRLSCDSRDSLGSHDSRDSKELRQLVAALTTKVQQCSEQLSAHQIGNAVYGLQRLGDSREVRELVAALTPKVQQSGYEMTAQAVGNALCGLRGLGDSDEMRQLVTALIPKIHHCREKLSSVQLGNVLYTLQSLRDSQEIRQLVAALTPKMQQKSTLSTLDVGNVLCVLRRLGPSPELRQLLAALAPKVLACRGKIELFSLSNIMHRVSGLDTSEEVQTFLIALDPLLELYFQDPSHESTTYFSSIVHEC